MTVFFMAKKVNQGGGGYNALPDELLFSDNCFILIYLFLGLCFYAGTLKVRKRS